MFKEIVYLLLSIAVIDSAKLPKSWPICKKNDPNLNECLKGAVQIAVKELANGGNPSLGVLTIDPLHFNEIIIDQGDGPVALKIDFKDFNLHGLKDMVVNSVKTDWKEMEMDVSAPRLYFEGKYKMGGKVLLLPINGDGDCELDFFKFTAKFNMKIKEVKKDKASFYEVTEFDVKFQSGSEKYHYNNLFNGDKTLGDNMNVFLNENSKEILKELGPAISRAFGAAFKEISNRIFSRVQIKDISP